MTTNNSEINELKEDTTIDVGEIIDSLDTIRTELAGVNYTIESILVNLSTGGLPTDPEILEGITRIITNGIVSIDDRLDGIMDYLTIN